MSTTRLYTEEQVKRIISHFYHMDHLITDRNMDKAIDSITPIELPSDEEIFEIAPIDLGRGPSIGATEAFTMGAKWVINKIKGGEK